MNDHNQNISFLHIGYEAISSLRILGQRSLLALLGIAVGCAAIIALINIGHNAKKESMKAFEEMGANTMIVNISPSQGLRTVHPSLDMSEFKKDMPSLAFVAPIILAYSEARYAQKSYDADILGTTPDILQVLGLDIEQGRFLSEYDDSSTYVVSGADLARELNLQLGDTVQIGGYLFEVIGILHPKSPNPLMQIAPDQMMVMPISSMSRLMPSPEVNSVIAVVNENDQLEESAEKLRLFLQNHYENRLVQLQVPRRLMDGLAKQSKTFSYLLIGMGAISLIVGGVGVMNVMLMNVSERRREIGIRLAIGARARDIRYLFLFEALCLSLAGSIIGVSSGILVAYGFANFSGWIFSILWVSIPIGGLASLGIGLFFGLYPAISASRLHPMKALRDD